MRSLSFSRRLLLVSLVSFGAGTLASCDSTLPDQATDAELQVVGGQFFRGSLPAEETGPVVKSVTLTPIVHPGSSGRQCSGELDPAATAVALAIDGDSGYWIIPAGIPDVAAKGIPTFQTEVAFSSSLALGKQMFFARAVDANGNFGPSKTQSLDVTASSVPAGQLVISLTWGNDADLDLHVVDPTGVEIFNRNINSYEPPPPGSSPEAPGTPHPGGILDFDSEASCVPDGRHAENVVYADKPPSGHYTVRVDTASLCKEVGAHWRVEGFLAGVSMGAAEGDATVYDAQLPHQRGSGVLALELDVP
jgi:hypothetical protein